MDRQTFETLGPGDLVMSTTGGPAAVVTANYGDRVTAVRTFDLTNPMEWTLIRKVKSANDDRVVVQIEVQPDILFDVHTRRR